MTTLEIILLIIIWICYGVYAAGKSDPKALEMKPNEHMFLFIVIAPVVIIYRAIQGIFKNYN